MTARLKIAERVIYVHQYSSLYFISSESQRHHSVTATTPCLLPAGPGSSKAEGRKGAAALSLVGLAGVNCQTPSSVCTRSHTGASRSSARLRLERLHAETLAKGHFGIFSCCGAPWDAKTLGTISLEPLQQPCNVINATRHGERQSRPRVGPGSQESASWTHFWNEVTNRIHVKRKVRTKFLCRAHETWPKSKG